MRVVRICTEVKCGSKLVPVDVTIAVLVRLTTLGYAAILVNDALNSWLLLCLD